MRKKQMSASLATQWRNYACSLYTGNRSILLRSRKCFKSKIVWNRRDKTYLNFVRGSRTCEVIRGEKRRSNTQTHSLIQPLWYWMILLGFKTQYRICHVLRAQLSVCECSRSSTFAYCCTRCSLNTTPPRGMWTWAHSILSFVGLVFVTVMFATNLLLLRLCFSAMPNAVMCVCCVAWFSLVWNVGFHLILYVCD